MRESELRDQLATQLSFIEDGLVLIKTEYLLPKSEIHNQAFIDILAKDRFGKFTIIEIKKSNQSAREAIHELFKYTALFAIKNNIDKNKIKSIIVAIEWNELLVPFSEYLRSTECQTSGLKIHLDNNENILFCEKITPIDLTISELLFRKHFIYLFSDEYKKNESITKLKNIFLIHGCESFLLIHINYRGDDLSIIYPYILYYIPVKLLETVENDCKKIALEEMADDWNDEFYYQEIFLGKINKVIFNSKDIDCSGEIGYPEKYNNLYNHNDWKITNVERIGDSISNNIQTDSELNVLIRGVEGTNIYNFNRMTCTKDKLDYLNFIEKLQQFLEGNKCWQDAMKWLDHTIKKWQGNTIIDAHIYNPFFISLSLYNLYEKKDSSYMPSMKITIYNEDTNELYMLMGIVVGNGNINNDFDNIYRKICGSFENFLIAKNFGQNWSSDEQLVHEHGLTYKCIYGKFPHQPYFIKNYKFKGEIHMKKDLKDYISIFEFVEKETEFMEKIKNGICKNTIGL